MNEEIEKDEDSIFKRHWFLIIATALFICNIVAFFIDQKMAYSLEKTNHDKDSLMYMSDSYPTTDSILSRLNQKKNALNFTDTHPTSKALIDSTINTITRMNGNEAAMRKCIEDNMQPYKQIAGSTDYPVDFMGFEHYQKFIKSEYNINCRAPLRLVDSVAVVLLLPKLANEHYGE